MVEPQRQSDIVEEAFAAMRQSPIPPGPSERALEQTLQAVHQAQNERHKTSLIERIRDMNKFIKYPVAAVVAMAIIVSSFVLFVGSRSDTAFADTLNQLKGSGYEFVLELTTDQGGAKVKAMVLEPGRLRLEAPGGPVCIIDREKRQRLILWANSKAAYRFDADEQAVMGPLDFLLMPGRTIEGLWDLQPGQEKNLGSQTIDGISAEGFEVVQKLGDLSQTIRVWSNSENHYPVQVEIVAEFAEPNTAAAGQKTVTIVLSQFKSKPHLEPELFSSDLPEGYTLADRVKLSELTAAGTSAAGASPEAEKVLKVHELWSSGQKDQAVTTLKSIDWSAPMTFPKQRYMFTLSEQQCVSLLAKDRQQVIEQVVKELTDFRPLAREVIALGKKAAEAGQLDEAEEDFLAVFELGAMLSGNDKMLIVRLVGMALRKLSLNELQPLYQKLGNTERVNWAREQSKAVDDEQAQIKKLAGG